MLRVDVLTLFPKMFDSMLSESMLKRAQVKKKLSVRLHDIRDCATDRHRTCDDRPFGGGPGMVLKAEPIDRALSRVFRSVPKKDRYLIYPSAQGVPFTQKTAKRLAGRKRFAVLCGHYEGVDERVIRAWVQEEISIGDYILTGGELPAMVILDTVTRLLDGVLGNSDSKNFESFESDLLEYPQYTRPAVFKGLEVPSVLLTGHHQAIEKWRRELSLERTKERRPDLWQKFLAESINKKGTKS